VSLTPRPLRVLFLASDGASVGHVTRALAVARTLVREARAWGWQVKPLLASTTEADRLVAWAQVPSVRLPAPRLAQRAGWSEGDRRRLAERVLEAVVDSFGPDVLVADTFPSGPQLEAATVLEAVPRRVLVRRAVRPECSGAPEARAGIACYHRVLVPDDPDREEEQRTEPPFVRVPPITLLDPGSMLDAGPARRDLGLPDAPLALVSCGGGADEAGREILERVASAVLHHGRYRPVIASGIVGPLPARGGGGGGAAAEAPAAQASLPGSLAIAPVPLQAYLKAFDVAIAAAGYNTAHELALAGVPALLFAQPRTYDDQEARALRFERAGLAVVLRATDDASVAAGLDRLARLQRRPLTGGGALSAAREILQLVHDRSAGEMPGALREPPGWPGPAARGGGA
jgi:predicted glycosyltransferase